MTKKNRLTMNSNNTKYATTYLISEELLKTYSNLSRNVGVDKIVPYINLSQPFYIEPVIGTPLMFELQTQISTGTLTEANKALILKIAPALSLWTDYMAARSLSYTITAKGITKEHSENSEALNEKELGYYIHNLRENAEQATELLVKYLCNCRDTYPLWKPSSECVCDKWETDGTADPQDKYLMYFPNGKRSKCKECDYSNNIERI